MISRYPFIARSGGVWKDKRGLPIPDECGHPIQSDWRYDGNVNRGECADVDSVKNWKTERAFKTKRECLAFIADANAGTSSDIAVLFAHSFEAAKTRGLSAADMHRNVVSIIGHRCRDIKEAFSERHINNVSWRRWPIRGMIQFVRRAREALPLIEAAAKAEAGEA